MQRRTSPVPVLEEGTVPATEEEPGCDSAGRKEPLPRGTAETTGRSKEEPDLASESRQGFRRRGTAKLRSKGDVRASEKDSMEEK